MRTTIDLPDVILQKAKRLAAERKTSVRALIIEALQASFNQRRVKFTLRDASFGDGGAGEQVSMAAINEAIDASREMAFRG
jgi:hypothetical protein